MPDAALQPCLEPRCPGYAGAHGYCAKHAKQQDRSRRHNSYGALAPNNHRFRRLRFSFLVRHPICRACHVAPASVLDHRIPHRGNPALFWDQNNWQGLCVRCHGVKTARETWGGGAEFEMGRGSLVQ